METSLRYSGDSKSLRLHAKEKISFSDNTLFQVNGELDTKIGAPTCLNAMIRFFHHDSSTGLGFGLQYNRNGKVHYSLRGKKSFKVDATGLLNFTLKGRSQIDEDFREVRSVGSAEFVWDIFNVNNDQNVRLKFGYNVLDKIPYFQIRENNWTINVDAKRKWNVRYDL